jgi:hypothetical protein
MFQNGTKMVQNGWGGFNNQYGVVFSTNDVFLSADFYRLHSVCARGGRRQTTSDT